MLSLLHPQVSVYVYGLDCTACDIADVFVGALKYSYKAAALIGLGAALSCWAKITFLPCGTPGFQDGFTQKCACMRKTPLSD